MKDFRPEPISKPLLKTQLSCSVEAKFCRRLSVYLRMELTLVCEILKKTSICRTYSNIKIMFFWPC